jgi:hypothetical protein
MMTPDIQAKVDALKPGEYVTVSPSIRAFRRRDNSGVTFSVKSNRPGMPGGAQQVTFDTFEEAAALTAKIGVSQRVAAYGNAHRDAYDAWDDGPTDPQECQPIKIIDPLLDALDDIKEAIADAVVDGHIDKINPLAIAFSKVCDLLRSNLTDTTAS